MHYGNTSIFVTAEQAPLFFFVNEPVRAIERLLPRLWSRRIFANNVARLFSGQPGKFYSLSCSLLYHFIHASCLQRWYMGVHPRETLNKGFGCSMTRYDTWTNNRFRFSIFQSDEGAFGIENCFRGSYYCVIISGECHLSSRSIIPKVNIRY